MLTSANFSLDVVKKTNRMTQLCDNNIPTNFSFIFCSVFEKMRGGGGGEGAESAPPQDLRSPKKPSPNRVNNSKNGKSCNPGIWQRTVTFF